MSVSAGARAGLAMAGPVYRAIESKLTAALAPTALSIHDDSHKHASHEAMRGVEAKETHMRVSVKSAAFAGKTPLQRHRMVHELLQEELDNGLHALQIQTSV